MDLQRSNLCLYHHKNVTGDTYYKGVASSEQKEKGGKKWTEYGF